MPKMQQLKYEVKFLTPAFLGNAEQSGQWRTPPFKALLRQWWRIVAARNIDYDYQKLREREAVLFGHAWWKGDKNNKGRPVAARASAVRIRLSRWDEGKETKTVWGHREVQPNEKVPHPEVNNQKVGPLLYLGYGPLIVKKVQSDRNRTVTYPTVLKNNAAIQAEEKANLLVAAPDGDSDEIQTALVLANAYGATGGRSRNGWGSLSLKPVGETPRFAVKLGQFVRPWRDALTLDWPHAIGADAAGPLVWTTAKPYNDWKALMRDFAIIKIGLRTMFKFPNTQPPHDRHWLSYPITHHTVKTWRNLRLPNSLRFKVRRDCENPNKLCGIIFHVPCLPPPAFDPDRQTIEKVWQRVHGFLDGKDGLLERIAQ